MSITVGLRIDVDTMRGTRKGVPALVEVLAKYNIKATFFLSVGPDNMGRHMWRLLKPKFFIKMLRSNAANLYGYDILLRGTAWPGAVIGDKLPEIICLPQIAGHEVGLHSWDHYTWQAHVDDFSAQAMKKHLKRGYDKLAEITGKAPLCSAAAGWRCNEQALLMKEEFGFAYNSDCRGKSIFIPVVEQKNLAPQIPVTLPTYDEIIGSDGVTNENYNDVILNQCKPDRLNVYTIHAEAEGIALLSQFEELLKKAPDKDIRFMPLKDILAAEKNPPQGKMIKHEMPGREGWLAWQG